jgi:methionyl-tRNA formyltransferase
MALKIVFAGTPDFAVPSLEALLEYHDVCAVYTKPDSPSGRGLRLNQSPVKQYIQQHCPTIPIFQPVTLKDPVIQEQLQALDADMMVVIAYGLILPATIFPYFKYGCVNVHASLLPRWRGAAPIHRALLAGDAETGVTIMQIDAGLDTGDMLLQSSYLIAPKDTTEILHDHLAVLGAQSLISAIDGLMVGRLKPIKQANDAATYANKIVKEEATIDWEQSAQQIDRAVRAFNSWPVARTYFQGEVLKIWEADVPTPVAPSQSPGTILLANEEGIQVATSEGIVRLLRVQIPGGKAMSVKDFLNARRDQIIPGKTRLG